MWPDKHKNKVAGLLTLTVIGFLTTACIFSTERNQSAATAQSDSTPVVAVNKELVPNRTETADIAQDESHQVAEAGAFRWQFLVEWEKTNQLMNLLEEEIDMRDFQIPMKLREAAEMIYEKTAERGKPMIFLFPRIPSDRPDLSEGMVRFPKFPKKMSIAAAMRLALDQHQATYIIRSGYLEIRYLEHAKLPRLLKQKVATTFTNCPLHYALKELSVRSGVSIIMDQRAEKQLQTPVTARFLHDVTLRDALKMLTDMAGLQAVEMKSGVYVTTPTNPLK